MASNCLHCEKLLQIVIDLSTKVDQLIRSVNNIAPNSVIIDATPTDLTAAIIQPLQSQPLTSNPALSQPAYRIMQPSPRLTRSQASATSAPLAVPPVKHKKSKKVAHKENVIGVSHMPLTSTPKDAAINLVGCGPPILDLKVAEPRKMLYISNLDPHTSEEQLCAIIKSKFGIKTMKCSKLVPADRDLATLEYVSFKVLVPENGFVKFLDSNSWPSGVIVREFVPRTKNLKNTVNRN